MERLLTGQCISEFPFKCKYCGYIGKIYPMHYCSEIKGMRDIEGILAASTIDLTDEEKKRWNLVHNPTILQRIKNLFK